MIFRYLISVILLFTSFMGFAQKAENVLKSERNIESFQARACTNDAGSIVLGNFVGQSERFDISDTIFLCWMDRFNIDHNQDFDLGGDPDPLTAAGIGYAWYDGIPTIAGPDLTTIESDPAAYQPSGEMVVYVDELNGNALFENAYYDGFTSFNDYINGGNVTQKYFAPITFDQRFGSQALYEGSPAGECVSARVDQAFTVVYLNPIELNNIQTQFMGVPNRIQVTMTGGMPEFDGSNYTEVEIQLKNKPSVKASIDGNAFSHGDQMEFTVPEYGLYQVILRDGISCEVVQEINVQENLIPIFVLDTLSGQPGETVCLTWSVRDFEEIQFIFGGIKFDPSVVQFSSYNTLNSHDVVIGSVIGPDQISVQWVPTNSMYTLPDGEQLAEICFDIVGEPGDCSPIFFNNTDAVFTDDAGGGDCTPNQEPGMICVDPPVGLYVNVDICGSRNNIDEGTVSFEIFGGTPPYSFVFSDDMANVLESGIVGAGAGRITIFDVPADLNYELIVTDNSGTDFILDVDVLTIDNPLTIDFVNVSNPSCFGDTDGTLEIDVSGSVIINPGDYSVQWSTNDFGVNNIFQLANGTYCVTVTEDFTGCEAEACINIGVEPLEMELTILDTAFCADSGGGRVEALVAGGTPEITGYNFEWETGSSTLDDQGFNSIFEDISPGMVFVEVWDSFRYCKVIDSIEMPYLYELEVAAFTQDPLCFGDSTGSLQLIASLGDLQNTDFSFFPIPPYTPSSQNFTKIGTDSLFADSLKEGYYRIEVTELTTGCVSIEEFFFNNPSLLQSSVTTMDLGCLEGQLGSATVLARGGTDPYILTSVSGLPDANIAFSTGTHTYNDLDTGTYYVTITDDVGCVTLDTFVIKGTDEQLSIDSLVYEPFECIPNATTDIAVYATSSGSGIFYLWKDEDGNVIDVDNVLDDASAGFYYIEVSDNNGCETIDSIELFEPNLFTLDIILTEPECAGANGGAPGSICVNTIGGTPGFTYDWTDGSPPDQPCLDNIGEGTYTLQVSDVNNCRVDTTILLSGPTEIDVNIINIDGISCNDGQTFDGEITVTASGGNNPTNNYSYQLSSGTGGFGQVHVANDLEGGDNWVLVSFNTLSGNVCYADTAYFAIDVPDVLEMDYNKVFVQDVSCYSDCDGIAIVGAQGGNDIFYSIEWLETGDNGLAVSDLCAGTYHIEITDANGCTAIDSVTVNQPDSLVVFIDEDNTNGINCFGNNTGQIAILHDGGNIGGVFTYNWQNTTASGPLATGLASGSYSVTVVDEKGCSDFVDITLDAQEVVNATIPEPDPIPCFGGLTCITVDAATGGSGPEYRFSINGGPLYSLDSCIQVYASDQDYLVEVFDKDGCSYSTTVFIDQPEEVIVYLGADVEVGLGEQAILSAQIDADNPIAVIEWTPMGPGDQCVGSNCQQLEVNPSGDVNYQVLVTDINGCTGSDEVNVTVNSRRNVYIPNVFSPNGDAYNERFKVLTGNGVSRVNYFRIFDRWGEQVYNEENLEPNPTGVGDWDGTFRGSKLMPGVYVYLVEIEFIDNRKIVYRGSITLIR